MKKSIFRNLPQSSACFRMLPLLFLIPLQTFSQTKFLEVAENQILFSVKDKEFITFTKNQETTKSIKIIRTPDLVSHIDEKGSFLFELPNFSENMQTVYTADVVNVDYKSSNEYTWMGNIKSGGSLLYATKDGVKVVNIQTSQTSFEIIPINSEYSIMKEVNKNIGDINDSSLTPIENPPFDKNCSEINTCGAEITVLVLFTEQTANSFIKNANGNIFAAQFAMSLGFESVNFAFKNSQIVNKQCKFVYQKIAFPYTIKANADLVEIVLKVYSDPEVNQFKLDSRADLVLFLDNRDFAGGSNYSIPYGGAFPPQFAVVESKWLLGPQWAALNTIGKLLGGGDSRDLADDDECNHGWFIGFGNQTLLATRNPGEIRQLHYSNPAVTFNSFPTGTSDDFNASVISDVACDAANYYDDVSCQDITFFIKGKSTLCQTDIPGNANFSAELSNQFCSSLNYTYEWRYNQNGIFNSSDPIINTSSSFAFNENITGNFFLYLTAISPSGFKSTTTKYVRIINALAIAIGGKGNTCIDNNLPLNAIVLNQSCPGTLSYQWSYNQTGVYNASDPSLGTGNSASFSSNTPGDYTIFLEITSSSGATNVASKSVKVGRCGPSHSKTIANSGNKFNLLDIVENNGRFNFQIQSQSEVVSYQVSDISGRILIKKQLNCLINQNLSEEFELTSNGIYVLTIRDGLKVINKKIVIQHQNPNDL